MATCEAALYPWVNTKGVQLTRPLMVLEADPSSSDDEERGTGSAGPEGQLGGPAADHHGLLPKGLDMVLYTARALQRAAARWVPGVKLGADAVAALGEFAAGEGGAAAGGAACEAGAEDIGERMLRLDPGLQVDYKVVKWEQEAEGEGHSPGGAEAGGRQVAGGHGPAADAQQALGLTPWELERQQRQAENHRRMRLILSQPTAQGAEGAGTSAAAAAAPTFTAAAAEPAASPFAAPAIPSAGPAQGAPSGDASGDVAAAAEGPGAPPPFAPDAPAAASPAADGAAAPVPAASADAAPAPVAPYADALAAASPAAADDVSPPAASCMAQQDIQSMVARMMQDRLRAAGVLARQGMQLHGAAQAEAQGEAQGKAHDQPQRMEEDQADPMQEEPAQEGQFAEPGHAQGRAQAPASLQQVEEALDGPLDRQQHQQQQQPAQPPSPGSTESDEVVLVGEVGGGEAGLGLAQGRVLRQARGRGPGAGAGAGAAGGHPQQQQQPPPAKRRSARPNKAPASRDLPERLKRRIPEVARSMLDILKACGAQVSGAGYGAGAPAARRAAAKTAAATQVKADEPIPMWLLEAAAILLKRQEECERLGGMAHIAARILQTARQLEVQEAAERAAAGAAGSGAGAAGAGADAAQAACGLVPLGSGAAARGRALPSGPGHHQGTTPAAHQPGSRQQQRPQGKTRKPQAQQGEHQELWGGPEVRGLVEARHLVVGQRKDLAQLVGNAVAPPLAATLGGCDVLVKEG